MVHRVEVLGGVEVVVADDDRGACFTQLAHRVLGELLDRFQLDVDEVESGRCRLEKDLQGRGLGAVEAAAVVFESTGGDRGGGAVFREKLLQGRQGRCRLGQVIQPKFEKRRLFQNFRGLLDHLVRRCTDDGHTELADAGAEQVRGDLS